MESVGISDGGDFGVKKLLFSSGYWAMVGLEKAVLRNECWMPPFERHILSGVLQGWRGVFLLALLPAGCGGDVRDWSGKDMLEGVIGSCLGKSRTRQLLLGRVEESSL